MITLRRAAPVPVPHSGLEPTVLRGGVLLFALACLLAAVVAGSVIGPVALRPGQVIAELASRLPIGVDSQMAAREAAILWELRMPRVVLGALVGATLSVAGAAYQGVFRNPLADPYLLGAASGAALGATLAIEYGAGGGVEFLEVPGAAFAGALLGVALAYALGSSAGAGSRSASLILAGVAVASFLTAIQTYLSMRDEQTFREASRWILGRLSTTGWREVVMILPYVAISAVVLVLHRRLLDVLSLGEEQTESLGVRTSRVRLWVVLAASLGTAAAVAVGGLIGFVGIVVPHAVRLVAGTSYRLVLPLSLVFGAAFLVLADTLARVVLAPAEVPVGVVTAFFGAPFFALLLRSGTSSR